MVQDVYASPGAAEELRQLKVSRLPAFVIGEQVIVGFSRPEILAAIAKMKQGEAGKSD